MRLFLPLFLGLFLLLAKSADAQNSVYSEVLSASGDSLALCLNGVRVLNLRKTSTNADLARSISKAINRNAEKLKSGLLRVWSGSGKLSVSIPGAKAFSIPVKDLQEANDDPALLLSIIEARIKVALGKVPFAIEPPEVVVPIGERRTFKVVTLPRTAWKMANSSPEFAELAVASDSFSLWGRAE